MDVVYALKRQGRTLYGRRSGRRSGQGASNTFREMDELEKEAQANEVEGGTEAAVDAGGNTLEWSHSAPCLSGEGGGCPNSAQASEEDIQREREARSRTTTPELFENNFGWGAGLLFVAVGMALAAAPFAIWVRKLQNDYKALATGTTPVRGPSGQMVQLDEEPSSPTPLKCNA